MGSRMFEEAAIARFPSRHQWDAASVDLLGSMLLRWQLTPGESFTAGYSGTVIAVTDAGGSPAVLKLGFPHREAVAEAVALEAYPAGSAPEVLRIDAWAWAMLLERISPGVSLAEHPVAVDEALDIASELMARLYSAAVPDGVPDLPEVVGGFISRARLSNHRDALDRLGIARLIADAFDDAELLLAEPAPSMLVHGDLNPGNILRSERSWVVIDPKPMIGDPAFDLWPLVSQLGIAPESTDAGAELVRRVDRVAARLDIDLAAAIRWGRVRAALSLGWYLDEQDHARAAAEVDGLRSWQQACEIAGR